MPIRERSKIPESRKYTLSRLENMWYKIDRNNAARYAELCRKRSPQPQWFSHLLWRIHGTRAHKPIAFMSWKNIVKLADYAGIPAELLVDEDYYFNKYGIAGYRLMFEAHRRGVSLAVLTDIPDKETQTERSTYLWYKTWYDVLKGCINTALNGMLLSRVLRISYERLGVPTGVLFGKQLHSNAPAVGVHGELTACLTTLGPRECAFLAGVAKATSYYYMNRYQLEGDALVQDVNKLLRWYFEVAGEKEKQDSAEKIPG